MFQRIISRMQAAQQIRAAQITAQHLSSADFAALGTTRAAYLAQARQAAAADLARAQVAPAQTNLPAGLPA